MRKFIVVVAVIAIVIAPSVALACSSHGANAANSLRNYMNGYHPNTWLGDLHSGRRSERSSAELSDFQVTGSQYMVDGNWSNRTYWVKITDPFGQEVEFQTTYGGSFGRGVAAEFVLIQAGIDYIENFFLDSVAGGEGGDTATPKADYNG